LFVLSICTGNTQFFGLLPHFCEKSGKTEKTGKNPIPKQRCCEGKRWRAPLNPAQMAPMDDCKIAGSHLRSPVHLPKHIVGCFSVQKAHHQIQRENRVRFSQKVRDCTHLMENVSDRRTKLKQRPSGSSCPDADHFCPPCPPLPPLTTPSPPSLSLGTSPNPSQELVAARAAHRCALDNLAIATYQGRVSPTKLNMQREKNALRTASAIACFEEGGEGQEGGNVRAEVGSGGGGGGALSPLDGQLEEIDGVAQVRGIYFRLWCCFCCRCCSAPVPALTLTFAETPRDSTSTKWQRVALEFKG
jgi:hypothetical protein